MVQKPNISGAVGCRWRRRANGWTAMWIARADLVKRGYRPRSVHLWSGAEPDDATRRMIVDTCTRLQNEMLLFARGGAASVGIFDGTVRGLIRCYQTDPDSSFHELRFKSKQFYCDMMGLLDKRVGEVGLSSITGRRIKQWYNALAEPKTPDSPPRIPRAHACMAMLRILFGFGHTILEDDHCRRLKEIMGELEFAQGRPRSVAITAEQAVAVRRKAHEMGYPSVALAQAIQFETLLRPSDVIGQWVPISEPGLSSVQYGGEKWIVGIDWREISADLILTHRLSKSLKGRAAIADRNSGKEKVYDLKLYSMVMEELGRIPSEARSGPLIVCETTGLPYRHADFRRRWRSVARRAGIPDNVQNRDSRAGGITEGIVASGGNLEAVRHAAGHSQITTTTRYSRAGDQQTATVAVLRQSKRGKE